MTDYEMLGFVIRLTLGLFALLFVVQMMIVPTYVEVYRQRLFAIRRELFLYMADGHVRPDEPAYVHLRTTINGLLRMAERATLMRGVVATFTISELIAESQARTRATFNRIQSPEVRQTMLGFRERLTKEVARRSVLLSPFAWPFVLLFGITVVVMVSVLFPYFLVKNSIEAARKRRSKFVITSVEEVDEELSVDEMPAPRLKQLGYKSRGKSFIVFVWRRLPRRNPFSSIETEAGLIAHDAPHPFREQAARTPA